MATVIHGILGSVTMPSGFSIKTDSWYLTLEQAAVETTGYADNGDRTYRGGLRGGSGSFSGFLEEGSGATAPGWGTIAAGSNQSATSMVLIASTGGSDSKYTFSAIITSLKVDHNVQGQVRVTADFVASGAITEAWVTS